jgi:hypothetical protein
VQSRPCTYATLEKRISFLSTIYREAQSLRQRFLRTLRNVGGG